MIGTRNFYSNKKLEQIRYDESNMTRLGDIEDILFRNLFLHMQSYNCGKYNNNM